MVIIFIQCKVVKFSSIQIKSLAISIDHQYDTNFKSALLLLKCESCTWFIFNFTSVVLGLWFLNSLKKTFVVIFLHYNDIEQVCFQWFFFVCFVFSSKKNTNLIKIISLTCSPLLICGGVDGSGWEMNSIRLRKYWGMIYNATITILKVKSCW